MIFNTLSYIGEKLTENNSEYVKVEYGNIAKSIWLSIWT